LPLPRQSLIHDVNPLCPTSPRIKQLRRRVPHTPHVPAPALPRTYRPSDIKRYAAEFPATLPPSKTFPPPPAAVDIRERCRLPAVPSSPPTGGSYPRAPACHATCDPFGAIAPRGRGRATPAASAGQRLSCSPRSSRLTADAPPASSSTAGAVTSPAVPESQAPREQATRQPLVPDGHGQRNSRSDRRSGRAASVCAGKLSQRLHRRLNFLIRAAPGLPGLH